MRRWLRYSLVVCVGVASLSGCKNIAGPFEARKKPRVDLPGYDIAEQERRGRDKYATFEDDRRVGPPGYIDRPSPIGR